jgi:Bacteriophage lambda head decoration protein D
MPSTTMKPRAGDFILSEANGTRSRENGILDTGDLQAGTVLGRITASGKYVQFAPAATNGSENAAGLLYDNSNATAADQAIVVIARDAEIKADYIVWPAGISTEDKTAAIVELNALGVFIR